MAKYQHTLPQPLDYEIQSIQDHLYSGLADFGVANHESYARCYVNERAGKKIPEWTKNTKEYVDVLFNDKSYLTTFFLSGDTTINENEHQTEVSLYVQARLDKLFTTATKRVDAELINLISFYLQDNPSGHSFDGYVKGFDNVYSGLDVAKEDYVDMGKYCILKFNLTVTYYIDCPINNY
jgi:hypothetical protein